MRHLVMLICGALFTFPVQALAQDCASLIQARSETQKSILDVALDNRLTTAALATTISGLSGALESSGFTPEVSGSATLLGAAYCVYYASDCGRVSIQYFPLLARLGDLNSALKAKACFGNDVNPPNPSPPRPQQPAITQSVFIYNPCSNDEMIATAYFIENDTRLRVQSWFRVAAHERISLNVTGLSSKRFFIHRSRITDNSNYDQANRLAELPLVDKASDYNLAVDAIQNRKDGAKNIAGIKDELYDQIMKLLGFPADTKIVYFYSRFSSQNSSEPDDTFVCPQSSN